ncbi:MAG: DUF4838 domain-containing protein [Armatimonadetes bacterium]|nr:DUF4838 domain-containing protein [Armatimonadota bacterium]
MVCLILLSSLGCAETLSLARDGRPTATIVLPAQAEPVIEGGALDLQHYVQAICGVELPIARDGKRVEGVGLYLGRCEPTTEADLPAPDLNPETYAIRVRDGSVFLTGRWPTPVRFAVTSFIEDTLGVRWFAPGELWESVPAGRPGELTVEVVDTVKVPDTSPRIWSGHAWTEDWKAWNLRNKTVLSEVVPRRQFQNFLQQVFPPEKYAAEHPEYYPLIDGQRWIPTASDRYWRPCESNPDVIRLTVEYARKWFDDNPNIDSFSLGMDDISHLCSCENCRACDPAPDSYEKREFSDRHYKFVNLIAREVAQTHPDRYVGTLIYHIARKPPATVPKLEDNVFGFITETSALWWREGLQAADHELTWEWARRCKHLSRYDYYGFASMAPRYTPHHMAEQIRFDKNLGLEGMYIEVYTLLPHTAPMIWATAKLQWDHQLDIDALLNEFFTRLFGSAGPTMQRYFDLLERAYNAPREPHGWEHRDIRAQALAISPEACDEGFHLLDRALAATDDPRARQRIDIVRGGLQYGSYITYAYDLSQKLQAAAIVDRASADAALAQTERLVKLSAERERYWAEAPRRDDLLGANLRGLLDMGYLVTGQAPEVEKGGLTGAMRVLGWYANNAPEELEDVAARLKEAGGPIAEIVEAWRLVAAESPPNLVANPHFEDLSANGGAAETDWSNQAAPRGWSAWARTPAARFAVRPDEGRQGHAAAMSGPDGGCYLQTLPAQAGERYLCTAWVKVVPPEASTDARLSIRFRTPEGAWHTSRDAEPSVAAVAGLADWQPLVLLVHVPEGAGGLVLLLGTGDHPEGARTLFDDVALYELPSM